MKKTTTGWLAVLLLTWGPPSGGPLLVPLLAHHSLANFDTTQAVRVKGTIVQVNLMNPHSFIYVEQKGADGRTTRWAAEGPAIRQFGRMGLARDFLKPGDVVEVCGYVPKEPIMWQIASADGTSPSLAGRLINAEVLVMPDGTQQTWGDYGVHKCFAPGYTDQHPSR